MFRMDETLSLLSYDDAERGTEAFETYSTASSRAQSRQSSPDEASNLAFRTSSRVQSASSSPERRPTTSGESNEPVVPGPEVVANWATVIDPNTGQLRFIISCRACDEPIDITEKFQTVGPYVKCQYCGECSAMKRITRGQKLVRCSCNCLFQCRINSNRLVCPRENCQRFLNLDNVERDPNSAVRITCAYCNHRFVRSRLNNQLVRCTNPRCQTVSSTDQSHKIDRGWQLNLCGIFIIVVCLVILLGFGGFGQGVITCLFLTVLIIGVFLIVRGTFYLTRKVSSVQGLEEEP